MNERSSDTSAFPGGSGTPAPGDCRKHNMPHSACGCWPESSFLSDCLPKERPQNEEE